MRLDRGGIGPGAMIYTITLNPALDHAMEVDGLSIEDAKRVRSESLYADGKGIDVSRALRRLGGESIALGFIGGHNGMVLVDLLKQEGVNCCFTPIASETRRNVIITARRSHGQTLLHTVRDPPSRGVTATSFSPICRCWTLPAPTWSWAAVFRAGSPTRRTNLSYGSFNGGAHGRFSMRMAPPSRPALRARPFAVKPNVQELRRVVGRAISSESQLLAAADAIHRKGVAVVIVSRRAPGLLAVGPSGKYRVRPPAVEVRSTVGAGDSTVAGFVFQHAAGKDLATCLRVAAAGTAATLAPVNQLCRLRDVRRLTPRVRVESLGPVRCPSAA